MHCDEVGHKLEHLHFRTVNLHSGKRHSIKHRGSTDDRNEKERQVPSTSQADEISIAGEISITSDQELSLFPPTSYDDDIVSTPLFRTTSPEEIPVVSVHYTLPELTAVDNPPEYTTMETTV